MPTVHVGGTVSSSPKRAARNTFPPVTRAGWAILAAIMVLGGVFRGALLAEPPAGFLVYNEGFYISLARRMSTAGLFDWFFKPLDFNNPPLYSAILATLYRAHVPEVVGGRLISVLSGLGTVLITFLLARILYDERTALAAAAVLAVMPGAVIVDHNLQVDSLFVFLLFLAVYLYVLAVRSGRDLHAAAGGVALGLSILTKQPAVLALVALAAWEVWRTKGAKVLLSRRALTFGITGLAVGLSWYLWQFAFASRAFFGAASEVAGRSSWREANVFFWTTVFGRELIWMAFPLAALAALGGLVFMGWQRKVGDKLVLALAAVYALYYVQFHFHSYYLLPLTPLFALAVGRVVMGLGKDRNLKALRITVVAVLVVALCFGSFMMMADKKWGQWSPLRLSPPAVISSATPWLYITPSADGYFGPTLSLLAGGRGEKLASASDYLRLPSVETSRATLLYDGIILNRFGNPVTPDQVAAETLYRPVLFGYRIDVVRRTESTGTQFYASPGWRVVRVGPLWDFGIARMVADSGWYLYDNRALGR